VAGLLLLGASAAGAATEQADVPSGAAAAASAGPLLARVHALIGSAACEADVQCRTVAIGHKACGGPEAYLAWSVLGTDADALAGAAAGYNAWRREAQATEGRVSDCQVIGDSGAVCLPAPGSPSAGKSCQIRRPLARPGLSSR
jgi:hypothetical protein